MTNEEALKSALAKVMAQQENFGFMDRFDVEEHWAVREAIEKQIAIPYKVGYDHSWGVNRKVKVCPTCDCFIDEVHFIDADGQKRKHVAYCGHCGQAIDYDEEATE